jgi:hypothetical protein
MVGAIEGLGAQTVRAVAEATDAAPDAAATAAVPAGAVAR